MELTVRPAAADDVDALWPLCVEFGLFLADGRVGGAVSESDRARLAEVIDDPRQCVVLACVDGEAVGYALAQDHGVSLRRDWSVARLHDLFVMPARRGRGIARELHAAVIVWCAARPVRFLEWQASAAAIDFYARLGYQPDRVGDFADHPFFEHEFPRS